MSLDQKHTVTLEDLLKLKRAERPAAEFWAGFDRELRAKQLAALVEKKPWWRTPWPRLWTSFSRYSLPLGAVGALALSFFSVHEYRIAKATTPVVPSAAPVGQSEVARVEAPMATLRDSSSVEALPMVASAPAAGSARNAVMKAEEPTEIRARPMPAAITTWVATLASSSPSATSAELSTAARFIAASFDEAVVRKPQVARLYLSAPRGFETRAVPERTTRVEPLAQMTPPSEVRRARIMAAAVPVAASAQTTNGEKSARQLTDERLYDTISRFGARGDRVLVKF